MDSFATALPSAGAALTSHQKPLAVAGLCQSRAAAGLSQTAVNCWGLWRATGLGAAEGFCCRHRGAVTNELERAGLPRHGQAGESPQEQAQYKGLQNAHGSQCCLCLSQHSPGQPRAGEDTHHMLCRLQAVPKDAQSMGDRSWGCRAGHGHHKDQTPAHWSQSSAEVEVKVLW